MNKKGLLTTVLVSTTILGGAILPFPLISANAAVASNRDTLENKATVKQLSTDSLYQKVVTGTTFDHADSQIILKLTHVLTGAEAVIIREDSPTGNAVGVGEIDNDKVTIEYNEIKNGHDYYIQYINGGTGFNKTEIIENTEFMNYINNKEFMTLNTVTSDDTQVTGQTLPGSDVAISVLSDDEYTYETKADEQGHFKLTIDKVLPGRQILAKTTGQYDSVNQSIFVQVGKEPVENWFYNPNFQEGDKGWFRWGSDSILTPKDGYANFISTGSYGKVGATQSVEARYGSLYNITMDIRVNEFNNEDYHEVYMGEVIPGGGINPEFSNVTKLAAGSEGKWQTITFTQPYFGMGRTATLGFTIWGVKDVDIKNVSYTRIDR
ncbi:MULTISPECIES: Ig-like domain-containing protein [Latilactobacillus]|uniref:Bacterial Ig domain-containing protein n=1 Tax=Latilactobacillus curvatus TaxID=28038 RepID=A0ABN6GKW0_LATCU|nr:MULTISPECIES: Ig-like domain-containing protein [Latilactobacillus]ASN13622.1 hypothetical protein B4V05_10345 [Latilactobacillus sakei]KGB13792.1 hypothetical protein KY41_11450 [Latilactobacillus sakei]MCW8780782.1 Ig-like domain-containing protein [Latilactobacillus curvatus]UTB73257.1 hypothetical protein A4W72_10890 [Latilactobacillus curvatus]BCX31494.1 hypothetical protein LTWDN19_20610 [Latilactobacillus curvatus]